MFLRNTICEENKKFFQLTISLEGVTKPYILISTFPLYKSYFKTKWMFSVIGFYFDFFCDVLRWDENQI